VRKIYESYEYLDLENLYTYPGTNVLRNQLNLRVLSELQQKEHYISATKLFELILFPIHVSSVTDIQEIHRYLFKEIYPWAGELRKVNISKDGKAFMSMQSFEMGRGDIDSLISDFHKKAKTKTEISHHLAGVLDNINFMHPFREGKGRTQREVIRVLALSKGYELLINVDGNDDVYHLYMDGTVHSDVQKLEQLFELLLVKI